MNAPAIEQVITAVVSRLAAAVPSQYPGETFRRSGESVSAEDIPLKAALRNFNVDVESGQDDSQEGTGTLVVGAADRRVRMTITLAYARGRSERIHELMLASDAEIGMRVLGRSASWAGTPVQRSVVRWTVRRDLPDRFLLVLDLNVQYRDQE